MSSCLIIAREDKRTTRRGQKGLQSPFVLSQCNVLQSSLIENVSVTQLRSSCINHWDLYCLLLFLLFVFHSSLKCSLQVVTWLYSNRTTLMINLIYIFFFFVYSAVIVYDTEGYS